MSGEMVSLGKRVGRVVAVIGAFVVGTLAAGCDGPAEVDKAPPIPAVKTVEVKSEAAAQVRSLSGTLTVGEETRLSFAVSGKLVDVPLREGSEFKAGQEIARLDPADFERELASQKSRLESLTIRLRDAEDSFRRQSTLAASGTISAAALSRTEAAVANARADQQIAAAVVATAEQNLRRTRLVAPRDGIVTKRSAKQFEEIAAGQPVYEVGRQDALEVVVLVPERLVPALRYGEQVAVTIPGLQDAVVKGRLIEIGATAEAGNAFRVRARLDDAPPGARSGMSASVNLQVAPSKADDRPVFAVPLSAIRFDAAQTGPVVGQRAVLFVFDPSAQIVKRRDVPIAGMTGNRVFVTDGLQEGDRIVTAGVAFLRDGQKARLWSSPE
jgi:membrane fusion protein, multidrug efflux system